MKIEANNNPQEFTPFTLNIKVESKEEANELYALFNSVEIKCALPQIAPAFVDIRSRINAECNYNLDYQPALNRLTDKIQNEDNHVYN